MSKSKKSPKSNVIAVKSGTKSYHQEGFANLKTGEREHASWEKGPSNEFFKMGRNISTMNQPVDKDKYDDNFDKIDWGHDKEEEKEDARV